MKTASEITAKAFLAATLLTVVLVPRVLPQSSERTAQAAQPVWQVDLTRFGYQGRPPVALGPTDQWGFGTYQQGVVFTKADVVDGNERPVVDLNISPIIGRFGQQLLLIGGGYLFVGKVPFELPHEAELLMESDIHRVAKMYFGSVYLRAQSAGTLKQSGRICVRSFTPDDAELDVLLPTTGGGIAIMQGGGNTGTTTKAP